MNECLPADRPPSRQAASPSLTSSQPPATLKWHSCKCRAGLSTSGPACLPRPCPGAAAEGLPAWSLLLLHLCQSWRACVALPAWISSATPSRYAYIAYLLELNLKLFRSYILQCMMLLDHVCTKTIRHSFLSTIHQVLGEQSGMTNDQTNLRKPKFNNCASVAGSCRPQRLHTRLLVLVGADAAHAMSDPALCSTLPEVPAVCMPALPPRPLSCRCSCAASHS